MPIIRKMRIVNPHKKRRRRKRTMSTAARQAFVSRMKRARNSAVRKHRRTKKRNVSAAVRKHSPGAKRTRRHKRNPLGSEVLLMTNGKKRKRHSRRRHRKSNPASHSRRRHKRNPFLKRSHRRHRNPSMGNVAGFDVASILKLGGGAAAGSIATRGLTQIALGEKNTGYVGYGANIVVALGLSWLAKKFAGKEVATGVAAGGIAAVILRYYTENISQTSPNLSSGMGDLEFSSDGLGQYLPQMSPLPFEQGGKWALPAAAAAAPAPALVGGGSRFRSSRF